MKRLVFVVTIIVLLTGLLAISPVASAECGNKNLAWLNDFPNKWIMQWEYKLGELTVRNYVSPTKWLGIYYRIDYPGMITEALVVEAPGKRNYSNSMPEIIFGEIHRMIRYLKPMINRGCWEEVYDFNVTINSNIGTPGVSFDIIEVEKR